MGKSKAPKYATTNYDTGGLFGSSTTSKKGTTYDPENWMTGLGNTTSSGIGTTLNNMLSNDYANDPNFQAYQDNLNRQAQQNFDASVLSPLANRGLMRSTALQAATNSFNNSLIDNTMDLADNYYNRQANNLSNLLNTQNALFNYITGVNQGSQTNSQNVSNYNMQKYQQDQANKQAMWNTLAQTAGTIAGAAVGGPAGAAVGGSLGKAAGGFAGSGQLYA